MRSWLREPSASGGSSTSRRWLAVPSGITLIASGFHQRSPPGFAVRSGSEPMKLSSTLRLSVDWSLRTRGV
jgi:hypothetical protein